MDKELKRAIITRLKDGNPNVRRGAAMAAGEKQITSAGPTLAALLKDPQWQVRQAAAVSLGLLGEERAVPFLRKIIGADGANDRMRVITILSQKAKTPEEAKAALAKVWGDVFKEKETNLNVLRAAAWAMAQIQRKAIIDPLMEILKGGSPEHITAALSGLAALEAKEAVREMAACLNHEQWQVRQAAAIALGKIKAAEAAPALTERATDPRWEVRMEVVIALNHLKTEGAERVFIQALKDERAEVRRTAAIALGNLRDETQLPVLVEALSDKNWMVRKAALASLGNIRSAAADDAILSRFMDEDDEVRQEAALAYVKCIPKRI